MFTFKENIQTTHWLPSCSWNQSLSKLLPSDLSTKEQALVLGDVQECKLGCDW